MTPASRCKAGVTRPPEPRTRAAPRDGSGRAHQSLPWRDDLRVACPVVLHGWQLCGRRPGPAGAALRAGPPAPDGAGLPVGPLARSRSGPSARDREWSAMQRQPNTNAGRDVAVLVCGSRDWTDEDAVRDQPELAVARFAAERLLVIASGVRGADRQGRGVCPRAGPGHRGLPRSLGSIRALGVIVVTSRCGTGSLPSYSST
jgi:hypothetical protein